MRFTFFLISIFLFASCGSKRQRIKYQGFFVEGNISNDTVFNGKIIFYDTIDSKLVKKANYHNGELNGDLVHYYKNGNIKIKTTYENNKRVGYTYYYNEKGDLIEQFYHYYDFLVGPHISFKDGEPWFYKFSSFDNQQLFAISYILREQPRITDLEDEYFFITKNDLLQLIATDTVKSIEYSIFKPSPPKYKFDYTLILMDSNFREIQSLIELNKPSIFEKFTISPINEEQENKYYAIKLRIYDSINHVELRMKKFLYTK